MKISICLQEFKRQVLYLTDNSVFCDIIAFQKLNRQTIILSVDPPDRLFFPIIEELCRKIAYNHVGFLQGGVILKSTRLRQVYNYTVEILATLGEGLLSNRRCSWSGREPRFDVFGVNLIRQLNLDFVRIFKQTKNRIAAINLSQSSFTLNPFESPRRCRKPRFQSL